MEGIIYAVLGLCAVLAIVIAYVVHRLIRRIDADAELLASRSFGEYAAGKAKMDGKTKPPEHFDPGF